MRVVGSNREHSEFELDPEKAYRRGRALDTMLRSAIPPIQRRVLRATAAEFNRIDEARALLIARQLNSR
jgi:hypothetical protein